MLDVFQTGQRVCEFPDVTRLTEIYVSFILLRRKKGEEERRKKIRWQIPTDEETYEIRRVCTDQEDIRGRYA
jgi:hypothetical protein